VSKISGVDPNTGQQKFVNVIYNPTTGQTSLKVDTELTDVTLSATSVAVNLGKHSTILPTYTTDAAIALEGNTKGMMYVVSQSTTYPIIVSATTLANSSSNPIYTSVAGVASSVQYIYGTTTSVSQTATFTQAVKALQVSNIGTQTLWVNIGATAVANQCTPVEPNVTYDEDRLSSIATSSVKVISNATGTTWSMAGFY
jgi:hypothetical protein